MRKHMKHVAIGGGAAAVLAALALAADGCRARLFSKKTAQRPALAAKVVPANGARPEQAAGRRELDELLSIE